MLAALVGVLAIGLAIARPELHYRADRAAVRSQLGTFVEGPNPLDAEFRPFTFGEPLVLQHTTPGEPKSGSLVDGSTVTFSGEFQVEPPVAITAALMISNARVKVIIMPSALVAPEIAEPVLAAGMERAASRVRAYLGSTSRLQHARDVYRSSLAQLAAAGPLEDRYRQLYLYAMRSTLVTPAALDCAVEVDTGKVKGFLFGRFPASKAVDAELAASDTSPLVSVRFTDKGGATDDDVRALLTGLTITPATR